MKIVCPHCTASLDVPDMMAGKQVTCDFCKGEFAAPEIVAALPPLPTSTAPAPVQNVEPPKPVTPPVSVAPTPKPVEPAPATPGVTAPPPSMPEPTPTGGPARGVTAPVDPKPELATVPAGYVGTRTFSVPAGVVKWVPFVCLLIPFLLTFMPWNGIFPADERAYSQTPYGSLAAKMTTNPVAEKILHLDARLRPELKSTWWMLPYLILLILAVVLEIGGFLVKQKVIALPARFEKFGSIVPAA